MRDEPIWRRYLRFRGRDIDADVEEELRFHLEMHEQELRQAGHDSESARTLAEAAFGDFDQVRAWLRRHDRQRQRRSARADWLGHLVLDLRYARRSLTRDAASSFALIATLGIGIATATVMFSILDALLLRPLPFRDPDELVDVMRVQPNGNKIPYFSFSDVQVWRDQKTIFTDVVGTARTSLPFTEGSEPVTLVGLLTEHNLSRVLGVEPILGRSFTTADAEVGAPPTVLIDYEFWNGALGGDQEVIGRKIQLGDQHYEIIGVMPRDFRFPLYATTDFWLPIARDGTTAGGQSVDRLDLVARLNGDKVAPMAERARSVAGVLQERSPRDQGWNIDFTRIDERRLNGFGSNGTGQWILIGGVLTLLLASAANAGGLLLTRSWGRTRELGMRLALGSSNGRLITHVVLESLLIGAAATILAGALSWLQFRLIQGIVPEDVTFWAPFRISLGRRAAAATFVLSAALALLISVPSAMRATRLAQLSARGALTRYANLTPASTRARSLLLYAQVTLSVVLLVGAALLGSSYGRLATADPGQRITNVASLQFFLDPSRYPTDEDRADFVRRLEERLETIPEVEEVMLARPGISDGIMFGSGLETQAGPVAGSSALDLPFIQVDPDYFKAFEVPLLAGRAFGPDDSGSDNVIINANLSRALTGGVGEAVGTSFRLGPNSPWQTIVGVVGEMRLMGPDDRAFPNAMILPRDPGAVPAFAGVAILTRSDPRPLFPAIRSIVRQLDPGQPIEGLHPAREDYMERAAVPRFLFAVTAILGAVALCVIAIGIYALLSYQIRQRRPELGVRMALGASEWSLSWEIARSGLGILIVAVVSGVLLALALSGVVRSILYGVAPTAWQPLAFVCGTVLLSGLLAAILPVRRAWKTNPAGILRRQ